MDKYFLLLSLITPMVGGTIVGLVHWKKKEHAWIVAEIMICLAAVFALRAILGGEPCTIALFKFSDKTAVTFRIDSLSRVFGTLVSVLWPLALLYAFEYMRHEEKYRTFFMFYMFTYAVTLGIAFSENMFTLYCFYEMLTMVTLPLVIHRLDRESVLAARMYLYYSIGGAAFAFIGMVFIINYATTTAFVPGGVFSEASWAMYEPVFLFVYLLSFIGFSVKTAMWPFGSWLPQAGVAPTPVTALLHAVAVVKAGAFAIIRLTYYSYGVKHLAGTLAQYIPMALVIFTIVYGCSKALKETHLKRRLAYSTMSNLSYILFGVTLMTPWGLVGALMHLVAHAFLKIAAFFCAGAIIHQSGKHYIHELDGIGKKMPFVLTIFTISALGIMGAPGLPAFLSKWILCEAAMDTGKILEVIGIAALLISAILTTIYMMTVAVRAYFVTDRTDMASLEQVKDPGPLMWIPLIIIVAVVVVMGFNAGPLISYFKLIASEM